MSECRVEIVLPQLRIMGKRGGGGSDVFLLFSKFIHHQKIKIKIFSSLSLHKSFPCWPSATKNIYMWAPIRMSPILVEISVKQEVKETERKALLKKISDFQMMLLHFHKISRWLVYHDVYTKENIFWMCITSASYSCICGLAGEQILLWWSVNNSRRENWRAKIFFLNYWPDSTKKKRERKLVAHGKRFADSWEKIIIFYLKSITDIVVFDDFDREGYCSDDDKK